MERLKAENSIDHDGTETTKIIAVRGKITGKRTVNSSCPQH